MIEVLWEFIGEILLKDPTSHLIVNNLARKNTRGGGHSISKRPYVRPKNGFQKLDPYSAAIKYPYSADRERKLTLTV